jgi:hypothetical protein
MGGFHYIQRENAFYYREHIAMGGREKEEFY